MLTFKVGDRVALPQVGVGSVVGIGKNAAFGSNREFYEIRPDRQTSTIYIPTDLDPTERGLRRVMTAKQARQVYEVLATPSPLTPDAEWRRGLRDRVKTGDIEEQAALVRDLSARQVHKRLSSQEKVYLEKAMEALVEELAEAQKHPVEEVKVNIEKAIAVSSELVVKVS